MSKTILLADDSVTIQKVIELTFMDEDYEVISAGDGDEALDRLEELTPDVVIADVHMPGASGFDVARRSRQLHPSVPVLLLVGTFEPFDESDFEASGADAYLKKPFDSQELLQRVTSLLESTSESAAAEPEAAADDAFSAAATRAVPSLAAFGEESVQPAPPAPPTGGEDAAAAAFDDGGFDEAGFQLEGADETEPAAGGAEPFPELSSPRRAMPQDDDLFGFSEADGSSQVMPPADMMEPAAVQDAVQEVAPADGGDGEWGGGDDSGYGELSYDEADFSAALEPEEVAPPEPMVDEPAPFTVGLGATAAVPVRETASSGVEPPAAAAAAGRADLSDDEVDRIARRIAELLGDRVVREVVWEVVPDLAEVVIKDRLRELESQVD